MATESPRTHEAGEPLEPGRDVEARMGGVAHGGHVVARIDGFVVFVRHALPGERVVIRITDVRSGYARGEAVQILEPHPQRRTPRCPAFVPFGCGGCDFQHASSDLQRQLKLTVLQEALTRHSGESPERIKELTAPGVVDLGTHFGWRTRMRYQVMGGSDGASRLGMNAYRSHVLIDATDCAIANPELHAAAEGAVGDVPVGCELLGAIGSGDEIVIQDRARKSPRRKRGARRPPANNSEAIATIPQRMNIEGRSVEFTPPVDGFWQVHPEAMAAITEAVLDFGAPAPGQTWWDLYSGMGPIAAEIAVHVGSQGTVLAVEASAIAVRAGRQALAALPMIEFHQSSVDKWLADRTHAGESTRVDGVVLDPPRAGAGRRVIELLTKVRPAKIVYVACDPVALARDTGYLAEHGYRLEALRAWDAFPQTHHLEAAAAFTPVDQIS